MAEYPVPASGEVPDDFFDAAGKITSGELAALLNQISNETRFNHLPIVSPSDATPQPGQGPAPIVIGTVIGFEYDQAADKSYALFKIPRSFVGDASFHVHWTKSGNASEQGNVVRWRLTYTVFDGMTEEIANATPTVLTIDDTYEDGAADSSRIAYMTPFIAAPGFIGGYYVGLCVDFDSGGTTLALSNPVLVSADMVFREYVNK